MATGERLKLARLALDASEAEIAEEAGISVEDLQRYEKDAKEPEPETLWNLAGALQADLGFFLRSLPVVGVKPTHLDSLEKLEPQAREVILAQTRMWIEQYLDVESFLDVEELPIFTPPESFPRPVSSPKEAADAGDALRLALGLGNGAIPGLADMMEDLGLKIGFLTGVSDFDAAGFVVNDEVSLPLIVVNSTLPGDEQRFAMTRELAFFVLQGVTPQLANHFAGTFLIPAIALRLALGSARNDLELMELHLLKHRFGVSMRRLLIRAASLRVIGKEELDEWLEIFRNKGWSEQEPGHPHPSEPSRRMEQIVLRLQSEGVIGEDRAAELLGMLPEEWQERLNLQD